MTPRPSDLVDFLFREYAARGLRITTADFVTETAGEGNDEIVAVLADPLRDWDSLLTDHKPLTVAEVAHILATHVFTSPLDGPGEPVPKREPFFMLPCSILNSPQLGALSPSAVKLFLYACRQFRVDRDGQGNNGDMSFSLPQLSAWGFTRKETIAAAKRELVQAGFIVETRRWRPSRRQCALYALTWLPIDACGGKLDIPAEAEPRNTWRHCEPSAGAKATRKPEPLPLAIAA